MKIKLHSKKIAGAVFGLVLLLGIGAASHITADAQFRGGRNWDGYPNWGGSPDLRQTALNAGFNEGTKAGVSDRGKGKQSNYNDFSAYQKGTKDYSSRLGDRDLYRRYFREAFEHGYNAELGIENDRGGRGGRDRDRNDNDDNRYKNHRGRNWDKYGSYGGSLQLRQTALNAGYNEGIKEGRKDLKQNRRFGFGEQSAYQNATTDYSSRLGDRELYRRYYREGYENGYGDGYNGY